MPGLAKPGILHLAMLFLFLSCILFETPWSRVHALHMPTHMAHCMLCMQDGWQLPGTCMADSHEPALPNAQEQCSLSGLMVWLDRL